RPLVDPIETYGNLPLGLRARSARERHRGETRGDAAVTYELTPGARLVVCHYCEAFTDDVGGQSPARLAVESKCERVRDRLAHDRLQSNPAALTLNVCHACLFLLLVQRSWSKGKDGG